MPAPSRTLILVKPDAFERGLTGEVLARFERKGLTLTALKLVSAEEAEQLSPARRGRGEDQLLHRARMP